MRYPSLDIVPTITEAMAQLKNVDKWAKPSKPPFSLNFAALRPLIRKEPKGTVLIISPFNYPVWLLLGPLVCLLPSKKKKKKELS
jgi:aldehyde dehydrogenase (NAD+)